MRPDRDPLDPNGPPWPPETDPQPAWNRWLDALATPHPPFMGADAPAYLVIGIAGVAVGFTLLVGLALWRGLPLAVAYVFAALAMTTFVLAAKGRQRLYGRDSHVLLQDILLVLAATAGAAWLLGRPVLASLDLMVLALGAFLACGRLGCVAAGCCHGRPASLGVRYRTPAVAPALAGVRLFPVPLVESAWTATITAIGVILLRQPPGTALTFWLLAYCAARFVLEFVRGDLERPRLGPLSEAQWTALALLGGCVLLQEAQAGWSPRRVGAAVVAASLVLLGWRVRAWWFAPPRAVLCERDVPAWERFLTALEQHGPTVSPDMPLTSPTPTVAVSLEIDRGDEGTRLYSYVVVCADPVLRAPDAFLLAGLIVQRLPRHEVLLARPDGPRLHLWVLLSADPGRCGSGLRDHPLHVLYRARAFARSLEALGRAPTPDRPRPEPSLLPPEAESGAWPAEDPPPGTTVAPDGAASAAPPEMTRAMLPATANGERRLHYFQAWPGPVS